MKTLYTKGHILALGANNNTYEALGIDGNRISFLGSNAEAIALHDRYDEIISLDDMTVLPGFNDSHMHLLNYGYTLGKMDLAPHGTIESLIAASKEYLSSRDYSNEQWLLGRGWNQDNLLEKRFPTRSDLDRISTDVPICFTRVCGHMSVCNSKALEFVDTASASGNTSVDLTRGLFMEDALGLLYSAIPSPALDDVKKMIIVTGNLLIEQGITSVQTDDFSALPDEDYEKVLAAYHELQAENKLPLRIYEQCLFYKKSDFEGFLKKGYRMGQGDGFFKIGPLKLLLDGSLGGRTALLREEYSDAPGVRGIACFTQYELNELAVCASQAGFQIAAHAIGDGAMDMALDAFEYVQDKDPIAANRLRNGIVHAQITDSAIIDRMGALGTAAYVQPIFLDYDLHIVKERTGERANEAYAFETMRRAGIPVSFGTDAPVVDFNPFENIYSAVARKDLNGYPDEAYLPDERYSVLDSLKAYTQVSAWCSFEEDVKGTLEIGKLADFIALKRNPLELSPEEIKGLSVEMTVLDGKIVFKR